MTPADADLAKRHAAEAALAWVPQGQVLGIGTGSTVNHFIAALAGLRGRIAGTVASSEASTERLQALQIPVFDLNEVDGVALYVDGADECDRQLRLIKGGGGALTREKIIAAVADTFVCIADESKLVDQLGTFPLPVEVIPMARTYVDGQLRRLGGHPVWREGFVTDNGNVILDVHGLPLDDPAAMEARINNIVGTVSNGLFAARGADHLLLGTGDGVTEIPLQLPPPPSPRQELLGGGPVLC